MIRLRSTVARIAVLHVAAIVVVAIGMPIALDQRLDDLTATIHNRLMMDRAESVARRLSRHDNAWHLGPPPAGAGHYSWSYRHYVFSVVDQHGRVLLSSPPGRKPVLSPDPVAAKPRYFRSGGKTLFKGGSFPFVIGGVPVWVEVAENMNHPDELIDKIADDFFVEAGWITGSILVLLLLIELLIVRHGLRPIRAASAMAERIDPAHPDVRLPTTTMPREILPMVNAVNRALDRMEQGFRMERDFIADAAHELRTPLAILQMRADTIDEPAIAKPLRDDIAALSRLVRQLLDLAEIDSMVIEHDEVADLRRVCIQVARFVEPLATARKRQVIVTGASAPVLVHGRQDRLAQAVRNLVDNALAHTPDGSTVEVNVTDEPAIHVRDHGPGIRSDELDRIFRRFWRRDRQRIGGAGLGLSIVSKIVACHGATIEVKNAADGGAIFSIRFPRSAAIQMESDTTAVNDERADGTDLSAVGGGNRRAPGDASKTGLFARNRDQRRSSA